MRLYRISVQAVETAAARPVSRDLDRKGNVRLSGKTGEGRPILVVVAGDDPDLVVTVFPRS